MQNTKILLVDDEEKMRKVIRIYLEKEGYTVEEAENGKKVLEEINVEEFSLIVLDVMMPEIDGWTICREIRKKASIPIIMLTARGEEYDKLFGFELGVDDYVTKPFSPKELVARIKAVLKRSEINNNPKKVIKMGDLEIDIRGKQVFLDNKEVRLTPKEFELLFFFIHNPNLVCSREQLLNKVWGYDFFGDLRTVDTHVKQIREKLGENKTYIKTIWGVGYKFKVGN